MPPLRRLSPDPENRAVPADAAATQARHDHTRRLLVAGGRPSALGGFFSEWDVVLGVAGGWVGEAVLEVGGGVGLGEDGVAAGGEGGGSLFGECARGHGDDRRSRVVLVGGGEFGG